MFTSLTLHASFLWHLYRIFQAAITKQSMGISVHQRFAISECFERKCQVLKSIIVDPTSKPDWCAELQKALAPLAARLSDELSGVETLRKTLDDTLELYKLASAPLLALNDFLIDHETMDTATTIRDAASNVNQQAIDGANFFNGLSWKQFFRTLREDDVPVLQFVVDPDHPNKSDIVIFDNYLDLGTEVECSLLPICGLGEQNFHLIVLEDNAVSIQWKLGTEAGRILANVVSMAAKAAGPTHTVEVECRCNGEEPGPLGLNSVELAGRQLGNVCVQFSKARFTVDQQSALVAVAEKIILEKCELVGGGQSLLEAMQGQALLQDPLFVKSSCPFGISQLMSLARPAITFESVEFSVDQQKALVGAAKKVVLQNCSLAGGACALAEALLGATFVQKLVLSGNCPFRDKALVHLIDNLNDADWKEIEFKDGAFTDLVYRNFKGTEHFREKFAYESMAAVSTLRKFKIQMEKKPEGQALSKLGNSDNTMFSNFVAQAFIDYIKKKASMEPTHHRTRMIFFDDAKADVLEKLQQVKKDEKDSLPLAFDGDYSELVEKVGMQIIAFTYKEASDAAPKKAPSEGGAASTFTVPNQASAPKKASSEDAAPQKAPSVAAAKASPASMVPKQATAPKKAPSVAAAKVNPASNAPKQAAAPKKAPSVAAAKAGLPSKVPKQVAVPKNTPSSVSAPASVPVFRRLRNGEVLVEGDEIYSTNSQDGRPLPGGVFGPFYVKSAGGSTLETGFVTFDSVSTVGQRRQRKMLRKKAN